MSTLTRDRHQSSRAAFSPSRGFITSRQGLREIALIAALWVVYSLSRMLADDDLAAARRHASSILDLERSMHLDIETWVNHTVAPITQIAVPMSFWYAALHYVVTPIVLAFVFFRHRSEYARARNAIVIGSAIGLLCYMLFPVAPPRLMPGSHYLDVLAQTSHVGWWSQHASAPAGLGHITNELAAMPSLHVGWTVWVAWALWQHTNVLGRALTCSYVAGTTAVVIATGNHWLLDAVAGAAVVAVGIVAADHIARRGHNTAQT